MYYRCHYASPIGELTLASDGEFLTGLWIHGQKFFAQNHSGPVEMPLLPVFQETVSWLDRYFAGEPVSPALLPLKPSGTHFQQKVWEILKAIPPGQTVTYGQIAGLLGNPKASQAVGSAVGHNPISVIIPCHRVISADGSTGGYGGGEELKRKLLALEGVTL